MVANYEAAGTTAEEYAKREAVGIELYKKNYVKKTSEEKLADALKSSSNIFLDALFLEDNMGKKEKEN